MRKETITYKDYNGNERTENFFFNLSKAELMEMELSTAGGLQQMIEKIMAEKDSAAIIALFKEILLKAYGVKSPDGKYFEKSPEISKQFTFTAAYSDLYMSLASDAKFASEFIADIVPDVSNDIKAQEGLKQMAALNQ